MLLPRYSNFINESNSDYPQASISVSLADDIHGVRLYWTSGMWLNESLCSVCRWHFVLLFFSSFSTFTQSIIPTTSFFLLIHGIACEENESHPAVFIWHHSNSASLAERVSLLSSVSILITWICQREIRIPIKIITPQKKTPFWAQYVVCFSKISCELD